MRRIFKNLFKREDNAVHSISVREDFRSDPVLTFKVYNAVGGKLVEFYSYDRKKDHSEAQMYIIRDDEDFGNAIKNIATMHRISSGNF